MRIILAAVLTAAIAAPAAAHSSKMTETAPVKKVHKTVAYVHHPAMQSAIRTKDVYVNGVYVGSDPDWRVRDTLRRDFLSDMSN